MSVICPILIGRAPQFEALGYLLALARSGQGQTALIAGEAGIGKSRLVAELKMVAGQQGVTLLQGHCFEPDHFLPYAPLLDLLRTHWMGLSWDGIVAELGPTAVNLATLLPELQPIFAQQPLPAPLEPEQERRRLVQTFGHIFTHLAAQCPLLLVIEDLHWGDETSLDVLLTLARRLANQPILLLLTYRQDELSPELANFLALLARERLGTTLQLAHLTAVEVEALLQATLQLTQPAPADFVRALYAVTEGNPFFIEELLNSWGETAVQFNLAKQQPLSELRLPRSVQVAVQRRLTQVSSAAKELLTLAAVAGRRFDFGLLQALTSHSEARLIQLLKELLQAQLVVEETADTFAFRHALTQQAVTADLLKREQRHLHHTIAATMEQLYVADLPLADLAGHFFAAEAWPKALHYAQRAGVQAQALFALRTAVEQFSRALEAAHHLKLHPPPDIALARGKMYELLGNFELAQADYLQAYEAAQAIHNHREAWQSSLALGWLWTGRDYARAGSYLQRAIDQARTMNDSATLAQTLNRVGNWHVHAERPSEGFGYHQEALTLFTTHQDLAGQAATLDLLAIGHFMGGDLLTGMGYYERAIPLYRDLGDAQGVSTTLAPYATRGANFMHDTLVQSVVPLATCLQETQEAVALAQQIDWRPGEAQALMYRGLTLGPRGAYASAIEALATGAQVATAIEHHVWMTGIGFTRCAIYTDLLALPEARQHGEQAFARAQQIGSRFLIGSAAAFLALAYVAQADLVLAEAVLATAAPPDLPMQTLAQRLIWRARVTLALANNQPDLALDRVLQLVATAVQPDKTAIIPRLWHLWGLALLGNGRWAEAEPILQAALARAAEQGLLPLVWRIHAALGKLYQASSQRERARQAIAAAQTILEQIVNDLPDDRLRRTFLENAQAQLAHIPAPTPRQTAKLTFAGLTQREREIATLIAQGKSNRAIADDLILSERTVAKHVENILSKLQFTSRAQVAAWVVEKGLAERKGAKRP